MRTLLMALMLLAALTFAYAGEGCGGKPGGCGGCAGAKMTSNEAHAVPGCAPQQLVSFHTALLPMASARESKEDTYIRAHAAELYTAAHQVVKSDKCCDKMQMKSYHKAAKVMKKDADRLKDLAKKAPAETVFAQMKLVEDDFDALAACCE
jgi:hypothetical protein